MNLLKKVGVIIFLLFFVLSFSGCEDEEETAQGRISNMTPFNLYNVTFADQNLGDVASYNMSDYKDLKLEGGHLEFEVFLDGVTNTYFTPYLEAPEKNKKYTFVLSYSEYSGFSGVPVED